MATIHPRERRNLSVSSGDDTRWHEIWRLVIDAESKPASERREFVLAAGGDLFVNRQALAILEGNDSIVDSSLGSSAPDPDGPQFAPQVGTNRPLPRRYSSWVWRDWCRLCRL